MNTFDLTQLSAITPTKLSAEIRTLTAAGAELTPLEYVLDGGSSLPNLRSRGLICLLLRRYGANVETLNGQLQRLTAMGNQFVQLYGEGPVSLLRAPARINILGEHIDYVSYLPTASLPFGSREHDMLMLYRRSATDRVRGSSTLDEYPTFSFSLSEGPPSGAEGNAYTEWPAYLYEHPVSVSHWSNYVKGAAFFARFKWGARARCGFDFVVDSSIPAGGGASSSSALVVLASAAVLAVNQLENSPMQLARDAAKAEWYVGTRGGEMDHITMALAKRDHAVLISYLEQQARHVALPGRQFRWVTFFSQPADKGREVMIEYNERAAISRIVLPALIDGWRTRHPERYTHWLAAIRSLGSGVTGALEEIEALLQELPQTLTINEIGRDYPPAFAACARSFPVLVAERADHALKVRARALHHLGEIRRVSKAEHVLDDLSDPESNRTGDQDSVAAMRLVGSLLDESHASLRDLYEVSTPEVERLVGIIRANPGVYGAHLMGGGFGGNVLALIPKDQVDSVIQRVQAEYYEPQDRQGVIEGSVMVSTPGEGLAPVNVETVWREVINDFNASGRKATESRTRVNMLLDSFDQEESPAEVWPVIVAAGKGTRSRASGLAIPKPIAAVLGTPAILHVLRNLRAAFFQTRSPIVIVSPETESQIRAAIKTDETFDEVTFVVQPNALGTGDAVLCAGEQMQGFHGQALVIWGTQPVIRPETMRRTRALAALFSAFEMVLPTAHKHLPYAPLLRDDRGWVHTARETHLEQAEQLGFGESNIGMFILKSESMFEALIELKQRYWNEAERRYQRPGGELGFPNELINYFVERENGVFACPIADRREEQGIKTLADVALCEQFISELAEL